MKKGLVIHVTPAAEHRDAYLEQITVNAQKSSQEPGCMLFEVFTKRDDPYTIVFIEVYVDEDAQSAHYETEHFKAYWAFLKSLPEDALLSLERYPLDAAGTP